MYVKLNILCTSIDGYEESFEDFAWYARDYEYKDDYELAEHFELEEGEGWISSNPYMIDSSVNFGVTLKIGRATIDEMISKVKYLLRYDPVNVECVFCSEKENTDSVGYFKIKYEITENPYRQTEVERVVLSPESDWQRHEMFDLAWNGQLAPRASGPEFFDQLGLVKNYKGQPLSPLLTGFRQRLGECDYYVPITFFAYEDGEMKVEEHQLFLLEEVELPITKESIANDIIGNINMEQVYLKFKDYDLISVDVSHFEGFDEDTRLLYEGGYYSWNDELSICGDIHYDYRKKE